MRRLFEWARRWKSRRTVQFRTSLVAAGVALIGLAVIVRISVGFIGWLSLRSVDTELRSQSVAAANKLAAGARPAELAAVDLRVLDSTGEPVDGLPGTDLRPQEIDELKAGHGVTGSVRYSNQYRWVGTVVPDQRGRPRLVLAGTDLSAYNDLRSTAKSLLALGSIAAAATVGLATWVVVRRALRPVERMRLAAVSLPEGERLPVPDPPDELRALAEGLNGMLARRDADTEWLRRFTGDAAHELRNPIGSIRAQAEVAVVHPDPDLAQETLQEISVEAERLSEMVTGLLALARAEAGTQPPARPVELVAAARLAVDRLNARGVRPRVQLAAPAAAMVVMATPAEVATVLDNLLTNALRYARALVRISLLPAVGSVRLLVDDDGPGIPEEQRARVFERFHRAQPNHATTGGSGLGLALVAEAVRRRDGFVRASASPEGGARIEVRWLLPKGSA
ncbi:sensor histidine kinase [Haloactinomyces albus]|uniref:histidine kinase n=1 Tax=Haloactinomyces albus TaxID=1352928 RepID=A0AAE4CQM1_9ACTN|nr:HAMP domain-containing sensor histidine kinase [Haloactinomyces albus]MDR7302803.1 signal transduction histidine kinase [Haloactinomyces albus]